MRDKTIPTYSKKFFVLATLALAQPVMAIKCPVSPNLATKQQIEKNIAQLLNHKGSQEEISDYGKIFNITPQEAKRRLVLSQKIGDLESRLEQDNPNSFSGLWLVHEPMFKVVVQFSSPPKYDPVCYVPADVAAIIEVKYSALSLAELNKMRDQEVTALRQAGINLQSEIDIEKNQAMIYVLPKDFEKSQNIIKRLGLQFPNNLILIKTPGFAVLQ